LRQQSDSATAAGNAIALEIGKDNGLSHSDDILEQALVGLGGIMMNCRDPWAVFGGAALRLHGVQGEPVKDIDVLLSLEDAARISARLDLENEADGGGDRFRSQFFLGLRLGDIPVDLMAGFKAFSSGRWQGVEVAEPVRIKFRSAVASVAGMADLKRIFELCGRPKDLQRLKLLQEMSA
jgi:hypothetical protein